jgi:SHS2 domain-containing protein
MEIENDEKRLFFGAEVISPWPDTFPPGRMIQDWHITLAFLGNSSYSSLMEILPQFPKPEFKIGPAGICDKILFLPKKNPRVAAYHIKWLENGLTSFQKILIEWLDIEDKREFLSHVSIARSPFDAQMWEESFVPLPIYIKGIHLYESVGNLHYESRWHFPLIPPFEEFEHTADIAFRIYGENCEQLYIHAHLALSFFFSPFISYFIEKQMNNVEEIIMALNENIERADAEIGTPFKAVSYHGESKKNQAHILEWEMIVDV